MKWPPPVASPATSARGHSWRTARMPSRIPSRRKGMSTQMTQVKWVMKIPMTVGSSPPPRFPAVVTGMAMAPKPT